MWGGCARVHTHMSKYMCSPLWKIVLWHLLTPSDGKLSGLGREERTFLLFLESPFQGLGSHSRAEGGHQSPGRMDLGAWGLPARGDGLRESPVQLFIPSSPGW